MVKNVVIKKTKKTFQSKMEKVIQNVRQGAGGAVVYIFETKRIKFTKDNPLGEEGIHTSTLQSNISMDIFHDFINGKKVRRSNSDVIKVFQDTCHDLGASTFKLE